MSQPPKHAWVPVEVIHFLLASGATARELGVIASIYSYRSDEQPRPWPSLDSIGQLLGLDRRRVSEAISTLRRAGLLQVGKRRIDAGPHAGQLSNTYDLVALEQLVHDHPDGLPRVRRSRPLRQRDRRFLGRATTSAAVTAWGAPRYDIDKVDDLLDADEVREELENAQEVVSAPIQDGERPAPGPMSVAPQSGNEQAGPGGPDSLVNPSDEEAIQTPQLPMAVAAAPMSRTAGAVPGFGQPDHAEPMDPEIIEFLANQPEEGSPEAIRQERPALARAIGAAFSRYGKVAPDEGAIYRAAAQVWANDAEASRCFALLASRTAALLDPSWNVRAA